MSLVDKKRMIDQLILHEGLRLTTYTDSTGNVTIGIGYNVSDRGWGDLERAIDRTVDKDKPKITKAEAILVCDHDIEMFEMFLRKWKIYPTLDQVRMRVVLDLAYNLGSVKLKEFVNTKKAIEAYNFGIASDHLAKSKWAKQVKSRAVRLIKMLRTGIDYI